jgi:hypothetical protein
VAYQIVWSKCNVFDNEGNRFLLKRGELVPDGLVNADPEQMTRLLTIGAVHVVDIAESPEPSLNGSESNADGTSTGNGPDDSGELVKPSEDDTKEAWVSYATDARNPDRISVTEARTSNKSGLVQRYSES